MISVKKILKSKIRHLLVFLGMDELLLYKIYNFVHLLAHPHLLKYEADIRRDFKEVKKQCATFRNVSPLEGGGKRILFVSLFDEFFQVKAELLYAKAFQQQGYRVFVARSRMAKRCLKYFSLFGINDFVFLEDYVNGKEELTRDEEQQIAPPYNFHKLMQIHIRNVEIGKHALSSFLALFQQGHLNLSTKAAEHFIEEKLRKAALQISSVERILDEVNPEILLFLERGYLPASIFFDIGLNRGLNVIQWCGAQETDSYVLKKYNLKNKKSHPFSLSAASWTKIKEMVWNDDIDREVMEMLEKRYKDDHWYNRNKLRTQAVMKTPEQVRRMLGLRPDKKTAVVFSHILWDATFFYGENLFPDYEQWLLATVMAACENADINWVIKLHPDYVWKLKRTGGHLEEPEILAQTFGPLPNHVRLMLPDADINTFSLFQITDYCVTVRGTIGIEMSCFGIPVITAGTGRYSHLGFTFDSESKEEYLRKLATISTIKGMTAEQIVRARKFAFALFKLRPFKVYSFKSIFKNIKDIKHPLFMNYVYTAKNKSELDNAQDLQQFVQWAMRKEDEDFLQEIMRPSCVVSPEL